MTRKYKDTLRRIFADAKEPFSIRLWDGESLPMTQEQLARMIGVQRNAISIVAHALQQAGVLGYSRGQIEIIDVEALRKSACECYHAVHAKQAHLFK